MKALLPCALLVAFAGGAADAAVTFGFTATPSYGFSVRHHVAGQDDVTDGDPGAAVSGSFTIDTVAAGPNAATAPAVRYEPGNTPFITATFSGPAIAGFGPLVFSGGVATHYIDADGVDTATLSYSYEALDGDTFSRTTYELVGYGVTTSLLGGILLPDFSTATDLSFSLTSETGTIDDYYTYYAAGAVETVAVDAGVVPEPATWGLMVLGFGLTGAAVRRRKAALAA